MEREDEKNTSDHSSVLYVLRQYVWMLERLIRPRDEYEFSVGMGSRD